MLTHLVIKNFRCIREAEIPLSPLTALVGPNASGKSAVLQALNPGWYPGDRDVWQRKPKTTIQIAAREGASTRSARAFPGESSGQGYTYHLLRLDLDAMRRPNQVELQAQLQPNGGNLTNVFASLSRPRQGDVAAELSRLVAVLADVNARPTERGYQELVFQDRWAPEVWYGPAEVSDGTILLLAFLLLQHQSSPPRILAIEEPERGLHPYLMKELVAMLRRLTSGENGRPPIQVVLATHSAELLDLLRPEEVRFLDRAADGSVRIQSAPTTSPEWEQSFKTYRESLGSAWLSGGLGGVPGG